MTELSERYGVEIIAETSEYILVYKPAGLAVQSKKLTETDLEHILFNHFTAESKATGKEAYLAVINRIDRPVEGLVLFAKTKNAAAELTKQLTDGVIKKQYLAVVDGEPKEAEAELCDMLLKDARTNSSRVVGAGNKNAKKARLAYSCIGSVQGKSLLKIKLFTGRHHQIRVQLSNAGMPIVGDKKYNPNAGDGFAFPALCSAGLAFEDPKNKKPLAFNVKPKNKQFELFDTEE